MEYFILEVDQAYTPPRPLNWYGKLDIKALEDKKYYQLPKHMIFQIEDHMQMVWTDIVMHPYFMVSKQAKEVIQFYEPSLHFVRAIFSNKKKRCSRAYYIPFLVGVDALTDNSKFNRDRSIIHKAEVNASTIKNRSIVRVTNVNQRNCILIRSDLAESLLTSSPIGIGLTETDWEMRTK